MNINLRRIVSSSQIVKSDQQSVQHEHGKQLDEVHKAEQAHAEKHVQVAADEAEQVLAAHCRLLLVQHKARIAEVYAYLNSEMAMMSIRVYLLVEHALCALQWTALEAVRGKVDVVQTTTTSIEKLLAHLDAHAPHILVAAIGCGVEEALVCELEHFRVVVEYAAAAVRPRLTFVRTLGDR